ncbi:MAG: NUDIX domain-containing protein [Ancrocorticia sp.]
MLKMIVGAAVVDSLAHPTRLLAAQRSYPESLAGLWEFPGGKVEVGESPEAALQREISEELSTSLVLGTRVSSSDDDGDWPLPNGSKMRLWLATLEDGAPAPQLGASHQELRWVRAAEIAELPWLPGDLQILPTLLECFES